VDDPYPTLGALGEAAAWGWYESRGYQLVARNWRCRIGELDLVVRRADLLVFCEVKTRRGRAFGGGWEAVTARKQAKVRAVAQAFLQSARVHVGDVRFDVASVSVGGGAGDGSADVELFEDAF
jgi:putative endonuclease